MSKFIEVIKKNREDIIKPVGVLLAICIIIPLALSITNKVTVKKIAELEAANSKKNMQSLIDADNFKECENGEITYYAAINGGKTAAYIFTESSKGYGGDVSVMTAIKPDGTVAGVAILDVSGETPGLGQNAAKESFFSQYIGLKKGVSVLKNGAKAENNEVDAVTGATITSTAVTRAVNKALDDFEKVKEATADDE